MHFSHKQISFSPTDITRFFESRFTSYMDHFEKVVSKEVRDKAGIFRDPPNPFLSMIAEMGNQHEEERIAEIEKTEPVLRIQKQNREDAIQETLLAMQEGAQNIYQAGIKKTIKNSVNFEGCSFYNKDVQQEFLNKITISLFGYADLLVKKKGKSALGEHYYIPYDFKIARLPKPSALIQLCCYCDILESLQGIRPPVLAVVTKEGKIHFFKTDHFFDFYGFLKKQFLLDHLNFSTTNMPIPEKSAELRDWSLWAQKRRQELDDVSLTARIRTTHITLLRKAGITKLSQLAHYTGPSITGLRPSTLHALKEQAWLQQKSKKKPIPLFQVLPQTEEKRGLERLPPPHKADVFLEMQGYPLVGKEGLEYLYGHFVYEKPGYLNFWALHEEEEALTFQKWLSWIYERWNQNKSMKIYHYGSYVPTALKKLIGKYSTGDKEIDLFLRNQIFIDLKQIVTQSLKIGVPSYRLKEVEKLYLNPTGYEKGATLEVFSSYNQDVKHETSNKSNIATDKQSKVVAKNPSLCFAGFLADDEHTKDSPFLQPIEEHNRHFVFSLKQLYTFLSNQQKKTNVHYREVQTFDKKSLPKGIKEECEKKAQALIKSIPLQKRDKPLSQMQEDKEIYLAGLLARLLEFHIREDKPEWWDYFARLDMNMEEMREDKNAITSCSWMESQGDKHKIQFEIEQEIGFKKGDKLIILENTESVFNTYTILEIDLLKGLLNLSHNLKNQIPQDGFFTLVPEKNDWYKKNLFSSLLKTANEFSPSAPLMGLKKCIHDLLLKKKPNIKGHKGPLVSNPNRIIESASTHALNLKDSVLCIQGPPGSGKTYTGSNMILHLLKNKKRIGVTAHSHKAILNVLKTLYEINQDGFVFQCQKAGRPNDFAEEKQFLGNIPVELLTSNKINKSADVVGGTAFFFSRPEQEEEYDYLFVDEAGQMSLANLIASARSAKNIVLIGDQNQLEQPIQATHPQPAGQSALSYYMEGTTTVAEDKGLFLPVSYRMHPKICQFISKQFYNGALAPHPTTAQQKILGMPRGIVFVPVEHYGRTHSSIEEAKCIVNLYQKLLNQQWINREGKTKIITEQDILIVAPYNVQVACLKKDLSAYQNVRIASVDKFQGQSAPVCILSMTSSTAQSAPRGLSFLLNKNRLNVALSRAMCLSLVVGCPKLIDNTPVFSIANMELMNIYLKLSWFKI